MICSPLTTQIVDFGTKNSNPRTRPVTKITPHHMAGIANNAAAVAKWHTQVNVSTNYYIAGDQIVAGVSEDRRSWASSSPSNDDQSITIEVANSAGSPGWEVSEASYRSLVRLCADICQRYGIKPHYDGTKNGTITMHKQFAATACPGPYLTKKIMSHEFENDILEAMGQVRHEGPAPTTTAMPPAPFMLRLKSAETIYKIPATGATNGTAKKGVYTITEVSGNWGKLKSGAGWLYMGDPTKTELFRKDVTA